MRCVALIGTAEALAVAAQERILRLHAGAVGAAFRMAAEASERIGSAARAAVHATELRRVVDRGAVRASRAPAVLRTEQVTEQFVAHDEERVDGEGTVLEVHFGQRRML